jgi:hypothetical protein
MGEEMNFKNVFRAACLSKILTVASFVLVMLFFTSRISAQTVTSGPNESELTLEDLFLAPGKLLATGADKQPSGPLQLKSYKVEEVTLRHPLKLQGSIINSAFRLTVTLASPLQGAYVVSLDDEARTAIITQRDGVSIMLFDAAELEDGAQISVARGSGCDTQLLSTMKSQLRLPDQYKVARRGDADPGHAVKQIRTIRARPGSTDQDAVEIQLTTPEPLPVSNESLVMQVGNLEVGGGGYVAGDGNTLSFRMSLEQFSRAQDGKRIKVKLGHCSGGGLRFGKLNKALLDQ